MTNPTLITTPFAENGDKNIIPESVGAAPQNATMQAGFPPITQQKISEGGIPPERNDFNGILNLYGQHIVHLNKGLPYEFDQAFADVIGGYPLNARLMLDNGDIVRSTVANNTANPNVDMTGWVRVNSASQIIDSSGKTQQEINNSTTKNVKYYGLKLDGSDETDAFLDIVDSMNGGCIIISGGTLRLSKTTRFASNFPKNDQPCVPLIDKKNLVIYIAGDAKVVTDKHAQGIFELIRCENVHIMGAGSITGAGNFPPLDGTSGRGEKGIAGSGYATSGFWGYYKNNSRDTTANTGGGFGGAFPQWGGGTASTWGLWNGGFIGNQGIGVLMHDGCVGCTVSNGLNISGFNGGPVQIGWNGDYVPTVTDAKENFDCRVFGCNLTDSYNLGVALLASNDAKIYNNYIYNMGHPDALITDSTSDPGYGISCVTSAYAPARNSKIFNNSIVNCNRKGLDVHAGYDNEFYENYVSDCRIGGLFSAWSSSTQPAQGTIFRRNTVIRCGWFSGSPSSSEGGCLIQGLNLEEPSIVNTVVEDNTFIDCWGYDGIIKSRYSDGLKFNRNIVRGYHPDATVPTYVGMFGNFRTGNVGNSKNFEINDNTFDVVSVRGLQVNKAIGSANRNKVYKTTGIGIYYDGGTGAFDFAFSNNHVEVSEGLAYAVAGTLGETTDNTYLLSGTATLGTNRSTSFNAPAKSRTVSFYLTFNGTTTPTIQNIVGGAVVQSATTSATGVDFVFTGIDPTAVVNMQAFPASANSPATSTPVYAQYLYQNSIGYASGKLGIKTNGAATGHIAGDTLVSGRIMVLLTIY